MSADKNLPAHSGNEGLINKSATVRKDGIHFHVK